MRSKISAIIVVALVAVPGIVSAQSFSGPHVEAVVGWNHVDGSAWDRSGDGLTYGGGIGYDVRTGNVVGGVLAELSDSSGSTCQDRFVGANVDGTACTQNGRAAFGGGRIGVVIGGHTMVYALGGYVNVRQTSSYEGRKGGTMSIADSRGKRDLDGYRIGAGIEQELTGKAFLKAEYRFTDVANRGLGTNQHQVTTGIGIRF